MAEKKLGNNIVEGKYELSNLKLCHCIWSTITH